VTVFDHTPRRDANVLVSSTHDASYRVSIAAARFLREVARAARSISAAGDCTTRQSRGHRFRVLQTGQSRSKIFHVLSESC